MRYLLALFLLIPLFGHGAEEGDLLDPEKAFVFSAQVLDANTLEINYKIADGYYLYREKFKFELQPASVKAGTPELPHGHVKQDEFFGRVETYRNSVSIKLPIKRSGKGAQTITLKSTAQGCADAGVCYPPVSQSATLNLPSLIAAKPASPSSGLSSLQGLASDIGGGSDDEFLPPEQAFKLKVAVRDSKTLDASFTPAPTYYMYRNKIKFTVLSPANLAIANISLPQGEIKEDPSFGKIEVYHKPFQAVVGLNNDVKAARKILLQAVYQGCSERGVCYPPITSKFDLVLPAVAAPVAEAPAAPPAVAGALATKAEVTPVAEPASKTEAAPVADESSQIVKLLKGGSFWLIVSGFFVLGLGLSLTPCVFPMIPILSGIIVGQGHSLTKGRAIMLSVAYVLGMAITYAAAGVAAGLAGGSLSAALQNPWVLTVFALIFVALAFSMFGFYEIQLPSFLQSRVTDASNKMKGGSPTGVFVMGALSALIVGPCVAPPLAGALAYISLTKDMWLGGSALFAMALGMGVPLLAVGASGGALLPRAGGWMNAVKAGFGVIMLGLAIWIVSPIISDLFQMLLWATLFIVSAMYLHAIDPLAPPVTGFKKFWKGVGVILLITGVAILIGALSGSRDILQPLAGIRVASQGGAQAAEAEGLHFERVKTSAELDQRLKQLSGKAVMLDFYADWCVSCKEFERFTFKNPQVQAKLKDVVLLQADVTENSDADKALLKRFGLFGPPGIIFYDRTGKESGRVIGYQEPDKFMKSLESVLR